MNNPGSSSFCDGGASQKRAIRGRSCEGRCPRRGLTWVCKVTIDQHFVIHPRETSPRSLYCRQLYPKSLASKALRFASVLTCSMTWGYSWCVPFRDIQVWKSNGHKCHVRHSYSTTNWRQHQLSLEYLPICLSPKDSALALS